VQISIFGGPIIAVDALLQAGVVEIRCEILTVMNLETVIEVYDHSLLSYNNSTMIRSPRALLGQNLIVINLIFISTWFSKRDGPFESSKR
jgi:hypothetical protein